MKYLLFFSALFLGIIAGHCQTSAGYPFEVEKTGTGDQALILIPGFACSGEVWAETKSKYEESYTCYTLTMEGFAGCAHGTDPSFEKWKSGIAQYIQEEQIPSPIIVGHSMGGGLAMALAADHPNLIGKIIVVDALPCLAALNNPSFTSEEDLDCSPSIDQMTALSDEQFYQMQKMTIQQMTTDKVMLDSIVNWSVSSDRVTFASLFCDFLNTDLRERIANIQCPTLVLLEANFVGYKVPIEAQFQALTTADLKYANQGLHFIMYDDKDWYFEQLSTFLNKD